MIKSIARVALTALIIGGGMMACKFGGIELRDDGTGNYYEPITGIYYDNTGAGAFNLPALYQICADYRLTDAELCQLALNGTLDEESLGAMELTLQVSDIVAISNQMATSPLFAPPANSGG